MTGMRKPFRSGLLVGLLLPAMAGCEKSFHVRQYPEFYTPELKTIAVLPFYNETPHMRAGEIFAARLAGALKGNGTYQVLGPRDLRAQMDEKDYAALAQGNHRADAERLRKLGKVQAFITGEVTACTAWGAQYVVWDYDYDYPRYRYGYWRRFSDLDYSVGHYEFVVGANVAVAATLGSVADGSAIHASPTPVQATVQLSGYSPRSPRNALEEAIDQAVSQLVAEFAVVPVEVKVRPAKDLRTAAGLVGGAWQFTDTFSGKDEKMFVVLRLPPACDRNAFRLTITPKGQTNNILGDEEFTWSRNDASRGFAFSPVDKFTGGMGPRTFSANFYANGKLVMSHDFRIQ